MSRQRPPTLQPVRGDPNIQMAPFVVLELRLSKDVRSISLRGVLEEVILNADKNAPWATIIEKDWFNDNPPPAGTPMMSEPEWCRRGSHYWCGVKTETPNVVHIYAGLTGSIGQFPTPVEVAQAMAQLLPNIIKRYQSLHWFSIESWTADLYLNGSPVGVRLVPPRGWLKSMKHPSTYTAIGSVAVAGLAATAQQVGTLTANKLMQSWIILPLMALAALISALVLRFESGGRATWQFQNWEGGHV